MFVLQTHLISSALHCCLNLEPWLWKRRRAAQKPDFVSAPVSLHSLHFLAFGESWITPENSAMPAAQSSAYAFLFLFFSLFTPGAVLGIGARACFCFRNATSHLMHSFTSTFNHLNSTLGASSSYYCYPSPAWPRENLHRRAEKVSRVSSLRNGILLTS